MNDDGKIDVLRATLADVDSLVLCVRRCYAGTYPVEAFDDPHALRDLMSNGLLHSVVAVAQGGSVVGHMGLRRPTPTARTAEAGNTVVDPECRGHRLSTRLGIALIELARDLDLLGTHGYPTTAHTVIQKLEVAGGAVETGVLLDYIPADTRYVGIESEERARRLAVLVVYRPLSASPARRVCIPRRHREVIESIFARAGLERETEEAAPSARATVHRARFEPRRNLLRIEVQEIGADVARRISDEIARQPADVVLVDLPLSDLGGDEASEALRDAGFFFGAVLPEYGEPGDVLRLQRIAGEPAFPEVATEEARALAEYAIADRPRESVPAAKT